MRSVSLAHAKAHFSKLVDDAQHKGKRALILRHGKPAAALVPVEIVKPPRPSRPLPLTEARRSVASFIRELSVAEPSVSAVEDLLSGRR
jgi:prevent-host-death family protein